MPTVAVSVWAATLFVVVNMKSSVKVAFCGVIAAMVCAVMAASLIPNITFAVPAVAGLLLIPVFAEVGIGAAVSCFSVSAAVSFFVCDKTSWVLFVALFGYYPVIKPLIEKIKTPVLKWTLKFLVFDLAAVVCYVVEILFFKFTVKHWLLLAVFAVGNIVFVLYDVAVSRIAALYYSRLHDRISSMLKR